jgi:hypothetical protein
MAVKFPVFHAGRSLPPRKISVRRLSRPQAYSAAGRIRSIEKKIQ